jgi:hypothetical protein
MLDTKQYDPPDLLTSLEAALLRWVAAEHQLPALTAQIQNCRVSMREYSGAGFFTTLAVPGGCEPIVKPTIGPYDGPEIQAPELSHGAGSLLFVRHGLLYFLEVYANVDGDPAQVSAFELMP